MVLLSSRQRFISLFTHRTGRIKSTFYFIFFFTFRLFVYDMLNFPQTAMIFFFLITALTVMLDQYSVKKDVMLR